MNNVSFKGGVHPGHFKHFTEKLPIAPAQSPAMVVIPMSQHIGAPCEPLVKVGDEVKVGQKIGDSKGFVSAPIHSSVSGTVVKVEPHDHSLGRPVLSVFIENDGQDTLSEDVQPNKPLDELTPDEIRQIVRDKGIVGLGGATFPAHVKLAPPPEAPIDTVIINGAECEPYLTADHRIMIERPEDVVYGLKVCMKALNAKYGYIGIEDNKPDAIESIGKACENEQNIQVSPLPTKYPQGAEKMLIKVITGREVPSGGLPSAVGVVNQNAGTAVAIADAVKLGKPLIDRVTTITGKGIRQPANLLVKVGTLVSELIEQCGGMTEDARKLIAGGPMMGLAQHHPDFPAIKGTSGILVLSDEDVEKEDIRPCIKCGRCVEACPVYLLPLFIASSAEQGLIDKAESLNALDCIECGCCTYVCPAKRPLTQWIRIAKGELAARRKK